MNTGDILELIGIIAVIGVSIYTVYSARKDSRVLAKQTTDNLLSKWKNDREKIDLTQNHEINNIKDNQNKLLDLIEKIEKLAISNKDEINSLKLGISKEISEAIEKGFNQVTENFDKLIKRVEDTLSESLQASDKHNEDKFKSVWRELEKKANRRGRKSS